MDVVLGAAVTGPVARLALVDGSAGERREVIDQSTIDVEIRPRARTCRRRSSAPSGLLIEDGHRLAATRVCWSDTAAAGIAPDALAGWYFRRRRGVGVRRRAR